jgi:hypothetical protein
MSSTKTPNVFALAEAARGKLVTEASKGDHDLRKLVGHANHLDSLMVYLYETVLEQPAEPEGGQLREREPYVWYLEDPDDGEGQEYEDDDWGDCPEIPQLADISAESVRWGTTTEKTKEYCKFSQTQHIIYSYDPQTSVNQDVPAPKPKDSDASSFGFKPVVESAVKYLWRKW